MWYYLRSQLTDLQRELERNVEGVKNAETDVDRFALHSMVKRLRDVIDTSLDYKRLVFSSFPFAGHAFIDSSQCFGVVGWACSQVFLHQVPSLT